MMSIAARTARSLRRQIAGISFAIIFISVVPSALADGVQLDGWPPEWEIRSEQVAALELAIAEIRRQLPNFPIDEFDILLLDKDEELVFLSMHESIRLQNLTFRGCGLPDNPTWEVGVSKDAARITRSFCPR